MEEEPKQNRNDKVSSYIDPMTITPKKPTGVEFLKYMVPLIAVLKEHGNSATPAEACDLVKKRLNLGPEILDRKLKNGSSRFANQVAWARFYLVKAGYIASNERGVWRLTELGIHTTVDEVEKKSIELFHQAQQEFKEKGNGEKKQSLPLTPVLQSPLSNATFKPKAFEILEGIARTPTTEYYRQHKEDFKNQVEQPFQQLMRRVAARLPDPIRDRMETEKQIFSRFNKNDFGQGGAWDFYWGAFYPKGSKRTSDVQLALWLSYQRLQISFYIGDYGVEVRDRFRKNCQNYGSVLPVILKDLINDPQYILAKNEQISVEPDGRILTNQPITWQEFLSNPEIGDFGVRIELSQQTLLSMSNNQLEDLVTQAFTNLFPLVLLAGEDDPMPLIQKYLGIEARVNEHTSEPEYSLEHCSEDTSIDVSILQTWKNAIERKGQAILYGPPGTGKTYMARALSKHLVGGGDGFVELVQFHPAYSYEDFMQGIRPKRVEGGLDYPTLPGRFMNFCREAETRNGRCVLIIDEINRANLARVFGELMYLLEYRNDMIPLAGGGSFRIPANVRIIGTMNTADRSIALVDHALRRRFAFLALYPNYEVLRRFHESHSTGFPVGRLITLLKNLNENYIRNPHYEVGISYFLSEKLQGEICDIWQMEIQPYLEEYFFDQPSSVREFQWEKVREYFSL